MRMMIPMKKVVIFSFLSLICFSSYAEMNQTMSGQTDRSEFEKSLENYSNEGSSYVGGSTGEAVEIPSDEQSPYVPGSLTGTPEFKKDKKGNLEKE